jgi:membrane-bound lytic murein transglycosylase B
MVPDAGLALEPRGSFAPRWLALGVLAAGLAFTLQHGIPKHDAPAQPAAVAQAKVPFVKPVPAPQKLGPSIFDQEAAMDSPALIARWDPLIKQASKRFNVPQEWIRAVMRQESGGRTMLDENTRMVSTAGAMGIMQVLPQTYADMRAQYGLGADPYDPHDNIFAGVAYLSWLHGKYGYPAMFAAYNDGPGDLEAFQQGLRALPDETRNYVQSIGRMLKDPAMVLPGAAPAAAKPAVLTRPDGSQITFDVAKVTAVREVVPGEYGPDVHAVIAQGRLQQGVREDVAAATTLLRQHGAHV